MVYSPDFLSPPPEGRKPLIFYIRPDGRLVAVSEEVTNPNGVMLSPDEKTLYATNGPVVSAFDVQPDGTLRNCRTFATLVGLPRHAAGQVTGGADGIAVDAAAGDRVRRPGQEDALRVGRGAVWKVAMIAQGYLGRAN